MAWIHSAILVKGTEAGRLYVNMSRSEDAISALLPVKNGQTYLEELLPNILAMLTSQDELIVVNDGSTDQTQNIIEKYCSQDPRIALVNTSGVGLVSALNLGIQIAKNSWVARFDVDDQYLDNRIAEQRKFLSEDVAVVFSDYQFISEKGNGLGYVYSAVLPTPTVLSLVSSQRTAHPSAIINKEMLDKAGGYHLQDFPAEDLALWLRMSQHGKVISAPLPLLHYTLSGNSISGKNRERQQNKKRELIEGYGSWNSLQDRSIEDFAQTLMSYREISHAPERTLLHIRDLFLVAGLTGRKLPVLRLILKISLPFLLRMFYAALKLFVIVFCRRLFRFFFQ
jgi:glycosyltransferase involved in cell wall biosynthesis